MDITNKYLILYNKYGKKFKYYERAATVDYCRVRVNNVP